MRPKERRLIERIGRRREAVLASVERLDADHVVFRPTPGSWSVLDVVEHLVKVEEGILSRLRPREPRTWREAARARAALALMSVYFAAGRRFKVPIEAILPQGGATLVDLRARWDVTHETLRRSVERLSLEELRRPMMRHPVLGLLTPAETLGFLLRHIAHHQRQIARIRRAAVKALRPPRRAGTRT